MTNRTLRILGTRGVPAAHGGFETFAHHLALHLVARGWRVIVYCQDQGRGDVSEDEWEGVERVHIPIEDDGPRGTIVFDWKATMHAARREGLCLTLGYNTAVFCAMLRLRGVRNVINMDGIEWRRQKWGMAAKSWFWINDWAGCWLGDHLVADNPGIRDHLLTRTHAGKITTIPYGAARLHDIDVAPLRAFGLEPGRFWTVIARAEPENSILEIVRAYARARRGKKLAVLGKYDVAHNAYHRAVKEAASDEVVFTGPQYDPQVVKALRFHSVGYLHGHQVGGTNPSLVEAMGAGNAVIAHDNPFNRWVVGEGAHFFRDEAELAVVLDRIVADPHALDLSRRAIVERFEAEFTWDSVLTRYETLLDRWA